MAGYTFAITYENMELAGWINEKLFDAFLVGTVPIYRGAPDVDDYFPTTVSSTLGISRPARSSRQVCASLGEDEIETYRDNARAFIASDRYRPFTKQAFADLLVEAVEEDLASRT